MHKAGLSSPRLLNVLKILVDGRPHESYELAVLSKNVAISASIAELRQNNLRIDCYRRGGRYFYQLKHYLVPCSLDTARHKPNLALGVQGNEKEALRWQIHR